MKRTDFSLAAFLAAVPALLWAQGAGFAPVTQKTISRTIDLPGELQPFLSVEIHAKVRGFVERVLVDRGSVVARGELLAELSAPEMAAQVAEAESKVQAAEAERLQAEAQLAAAQSTAGRLAKAAETPGAVAGNELRLAQLQVDAAKALAQSKRDASRAAQAAVKGQKELQSYLRIAAPFDGVVTDRMVHPGALVGPGADPAMLVIQQVTRLRLVIAAPEADIGGIATGARVEFRVPAYPDREFSGTVARVSHAVDEKTRTMPVELDVINRDSALAPGMYAAVKWPVKGSRPVLLVPRTSVVSTSERTFVVRNHNGRAEWVDVVRGGAVGDTVEVSGSLQAGDFVLKRATDEIRDGSALPAVPKKP